ncbi:MAG: CheR family methyltransferase [Sulfurimonas sp.]|jgi:chemotaxis protein methyltransferase CheR|nr:CheR family methyltransferase [Sulfurimonadaceae bacterium]
MFSFFRKKDVQEPQTTKKCVVEEFEDVAGVARYFKDETGVTFDNQESILKNKLKSFCKQRDICSFDELLSKIDINSTLKQELIDTLTTNETFFYREFKQIKQLVELVEQDSKKVDILCAPCSTGEEPYSIAIALLEAGVSEDRFSIVGIDINQSAIDKAKEAVYKERNVRNLSDIVLQNYFRKSGDEFILNDNISSKVSFRVANIFDNSFKSIGKFDYIFSRNMLIYFDYETKLKAKKILESLRKDETHEVFFGHADLF